MPTVVVIDNHESRGAQIKEMLDAHGYETFVLSDPKDASSKNWKRFPDAIFLAEGVPGSAIQSGSPGMLICEDPDAADLRRLDALLLIAMQRMSTSESGFPMGPSL